jgi:hypothetical protein
MSSIVQHRENDELSAVEEHQVGDHPLSHGSKHQWEPDVKQSFLI